MWRDTVIPAVAGDGAQFIAGGVNTGKVRRGLASSMLFNAF